MAMTVETQDFPELNRRGSSQNSVDEKEQQKDLEHEQVRDGEYDLNSHDM